ncbi:MAG: hypothetical protein JWO42_1651 [Chloroflexi bacterium]|nr:hypothetical protein [Chloroflexota bacterium]
MCWQTIINTANFLPVTSNLAEYAKLQSDLAPDAAQAKH